LAHWLLYVTTPGNYSQTKLKEERKNLTINGKNYGNARQRNYLIYMNLKIDAFVITRWSHELTNAHNTDGYYFI